MKVMQCLLDVNNKMIIKNATVSEGIAQQDKNYLWGDRESGIIDTVVFHYISALETNPGNPYRIESVLKIFITYGVSSHYLINREGDIYQLVPEDKRAWHCGGSIMPEPDLREGVNEFSIGVELVATGDSGFTDAQYDSLVSLCQDIEKRYKINQYLGHEDIAGENAVKMGLRKDRKTDPGPRFDWKRFYSEKGSYSA
ncbi:N-acetylmuramoyl-L-alanine amidase [Fibrobacterota bacterium]